MKRRQFLEACAASLAAASSLGAAPAAQEAEASAGKPILADRLTELSNTPQDATPEAASTFAPENR